jgi:hypothetical protein
VRGLLEAYAARTPVRRVAVIGNAPLEHSASRAAAIDSADLVMRCNSFVLDEPGEPPTQGRSVHAVVFSRGLLATRYSYDRYRDRLYLVTEPSRVYSDRPLARYVKDWPTWWPRDLGFVAVPNTEFAMPLLEELGVPWRDEVVVPTTGTMMAYIARRCFPAAEMVIAGFSMIDYPEQSEWEHQWGDTSPIGGAHRIATEGEMLRRWIDEGRVTLHR